MYHFKIKKSENGQFYCVFVSSNGQTVFTTEMYTTKQSAMEAADIAKQHAGGATVQDET